MQMLSHAVLVITEDIASQAMVQQALASRGCVATFALSLPEFQARLHSNFEFAIFDIGSTRAWGSQAIVLLRECAEAFPVYLIPKLALVRDDSKLLLSWLTETPASTQGDSVVEMGNLRLHKEFPLAWIDGSTKTIRRGEWEVLLALITNAPMPVTKQVLMQLSARGEPMGVNAVEAKIHRLRAFLEHTNLRVTTLPKFGYLIQESGHQGQ